MAISRLHHFPGPNLYARCPILEIAFEGPAAQARTLGLTVLELQNQVGVPASFLSVETISSHACRIAVECPLPTVGRTAAEMARHLAPGSKPTAEDFRRLKDLEYQERLPASTAVIYHAARRRNIPARRLHPEYGRFLVLGHGSKQQRLQASEPNTVGTVSRTASTDKYLAKELMAAAGVPVPVGKLISTAEEAWPTACELGLPVAIKPLDSDLQTGVSLDLKTQESVEAGFRHAQEHSRWVLMERFAPGVEHRVLMVDGKVAAVTRIDPPQVQGDGKHTVAQLVEQANQDPRRGDEGSGAPKAKLKLDEEARTVIAGQGYRLDSVPPAGARVLVRRNPPYFKNGGNLIDLTDEIHPSIAAHAAAACHALQLNVAGLDVVAEDITRPLEEQQGVIVEINAGPGLWLHLAPWADRPRPVGDAIVGSLFPPGEEGRIPVLALVANDFQAAEVQAACVKIAAQLALKGLRVGWVQPGRMSVEGRSWPAPTDPQTRAQQLFQFPAVDAAILITTPAELLEFGFGNDRCDLALDLVGSDGDYRRALSNALAEGGSMTATVEDFVQRMLANLETTVAGCGPLNRRPG